MSLEPEDALSSAAESEPEQIISASETAKPKKKKKKKKKSASAKAKEEALHKPAPITLKISRAKHWRYISSYHGQWLQLPNELIETLLAINCSSSTRYDNFDDVLPISYAEQMGIVPLRPNSRPKDNLPPPIDKAVFLGVSSVRKYIEMASDLALRAASGLSAAAQGAFSDNPPPYGNHEGPSPSFGNPRNVGRSQYMSATRQNRLRAMAVSKLAEAYKVDEIAAAVAVMQGSTALDDLAERVLKYDPTNNDARYVQFFHEKIPSRTLAQSTTTAPLDALIASHPNKLEYYRTCGIIHAAKQEFAEAIEVYSQALAIARSMRKAKGQEQIKRTMHGSRKSRKSKHTNLKEEESMEKEVEDGDTGSITAIDEAEQVGLIPGDDVERQIFFLRGMCYFHWAFNLLETTTMKIEGTPVPLSPALVNEGGEATLDALGISDARLHEKGLLDSEGKRKQYEQAFQDVDLRTEVVELFTRAARDHERYISYFPVFQVAKGSPFEVDKKNLPPIRARRAREDKFLSAHMQRILAHRSLEGRTRYTHPVDGRPDEGQSYLTTYHPLLTESYFTLLISTLMIGDFSVAMKKHYYTASLLSNLEGFPVFLPARSMNQAQYSEVLERMAGTWLEVREAHGIRPPRGTEEEIAELGEIESLHHLASFFTSHHDQLIELAADRASATTNGDTKPKSPLAITNGESSAISSASNGKIPLSARAEIASAWLQVGIIPTRYHEQVELQAEPYMNGTSSSHQGKGKGKA